MLGESDADVAQSLQGMLDLRRETLQQVLTGQLGPLERRLTLFERRRNLVFGRERSDEVVSSSSDEEPEPEQETEQNEEESHSIEPASSVEVNVESPSEDALRVANFLAEKHSDAESIALSSEDSVRVHQESGGSFLLNVPEVLEREFGESRDSETTAASTPSMSAAAAEKHG